MTVPQWTSRFAQDDVGGEDHLGVEGAAQGYQQFLIPGIITTTDRARYYSFYCWVLRRFIYDPGSSRLLADFKGPYFRRHELAFILGCFSHHLDRGGITGLVGSGLNNIKARRLWEGSDPASLDANYFGNSLGGFGQYYFTAMQTMGLVAPAERPRWVYRLTDRGDALGEAFEASVRETGYFQVLARAGELESLGHETAEEYGSHACLCAESLRNGADRELLRDAFFRFDCREGTSNSHVRRRLTLGLLLDMVAKSGSVSFRSALRPALHFGQYTAGQEYKPEAALRDWWARWRLVQVRHTYTFALQTLWAGFLDHLRDEQSNGITFPEVIDWAVAQLPGETTTMSVPAYMDSLSVAAGLQPSWADVHSLFDVACRQETGFNEHSLCMAAMSARDRDPRLLVGSALRILCQLFLRFLALHQAEDPIWNELAQQWRLPMSCFFQDLARNLQSDRWQIRDLLAWLYREYILGQHEFVALQKLRYQQYDTFKFRFQDGVFSWPPGSRYSEPIRFPALRLFNALTILVDLGLVEEDPNRVCCLTVDGRRYLEGVLEAGDGA